MISIDRSSKKQVLEQLKEQLRYALATGAFPIDSRMPSTRVLAAQLTISFHTVRKAYQDLSEEGLLEAVQGSGFRVLERVAPNTEERMEKGASIVHDALQQLLGLGLEESEVEYLLAEQFSVLEKASERPRVLFVATYTEMAEACAEVVSHTLQVPVEAVSLRALSRELDTEYAITPHTLLREAMDRLPQSDVIGATIYLTPETLDRVARLRAHETLGVVSYYAETIPHLMKEIQHQTGFEGQILGASIEQGARHISQLTGQFDVLVYTPKSRRRLLQVRHDIQHLLSPIGWYIARDSIDAIKEMLPS
ncbi:MAG: GntR family transcriptional regulator [Rhodothermales bacterium]|nr:GntR family transcriptional regulator [Rhodothermales bacterium]